MKKVLLVFLCVILCSCGRKSDLSAKLDQIFDEQGYLQFRRNNYSDYAEYYLPSDISEMAADEISSIMSFNNSHLIMDINVSGIINSKYYPDNPLSAEGFFDPARLVYNRQGTYQFSEEGEAEYIYQVYEYDDEYLCYFLSRDLIFYGYAGLEDVIELSSRIFLIARSANIYEDNVIAVYSSKDVIDYEKKQVNLFETIMPVNGNINDFMLDKQEEETAE